MSVVACPTPWRSEAASLWFSVYWVFFFRDYLCVSAEPDLRGGRGAALVNWGGGATESSTGIDFFILFGFDLMEK
jgi:hypothetical protein